MLSQQVVFSDDDDDETSKKILDYSFLENICQHSSVFSPKKEVEDYHNDNNENVIISPLGNEDHLANLPTTNQSKLNILGNPFTSPKKNVYDLSQLASPPHETKDVRLKVLFREISPTRSELDLKMTLEQKEKFCKGVLSPKVRSGSLPSTPKSSCRTPLSALEVRQLKLREIMRSEDPDPEWCPDKKRRLCLMSKLEEVKECQEVDDTCVVQIDTPTRNLRPRKKQDFDSEDELPLQELRDRLINQKTADDDDDLNLRLDPLSDDDQPIVSSRRQMSSSPNQPERNVMISYEGRKVLKVRLPIDSLMCRIDNKQELSLEQCALIRSSPLKSSQRPVLNLSQESIRIPSEFDISSADSDWGRNTNFSTPKSSMRKSSKRKATNSVSSSKKRICVIESDSDDDILLTWKSIKVASTADETPVAHEDSTSENTPKRKANHCPVVTPLRKRLKREQSAYHSDSDDDMPLINVARMCQTERACRKRKHKRKPSN